MCIRDRQNDGYVEKMNSYITKKVADKLNQLFKADRTAYEGFWDDIGMFFKYGCMREEKLYDKIKDALLLKTTDGIYETVAEYLEKNKEKHENKIFFVTDEAQPVSYTHLTTATAANRIFFFLVRVLSSS